MVWKIIRENAVMAQDSPKLTLQTAVDASGKGKRDGSEFEGRGLISSLPPRSRAPVACPSQKVRNTSSFISHLFPSTRKMDSLLRWSIENSTPRNPDAPPPARKDLDPEIIDYLLGKPDAVLMKEALDVALDDKRDDGARIQALDDFEMLVENIDNANGTLRRSIVRSRNLWKRF